MSPPNLLTIPHELRQRILKFTRPDWDLRVDCKPTFIAWKFVPQYTHKETSKWVRDLCLVNSEIAQDMVWVQEQWVKRGEELAREQKGKKRTRIGTTWTKKSRKAEQQRVSGKCKAALKEQHPMFKEKVAFAYSKQLSWIAQFEGVPYQWVEELMPLGYTGMVANVGSGEQLIVVRRKNYPDMSGSPASSFLSTPLA